MAKASIVEAITCRWVKGYRDHGPEVTKFDIDETVYAYVEISGDDLFGKTIKHEWWYNGEKRWEWTKTCDKHYTSWSTWTWWDIGINYGPGSGHIEAYCDGRYLGSTNQFKMIECSEGAYELLDYCPDGVTVKKERRCENGKWKTYEYDCPECSEGDSEVLEYCPDGGTVKRERRCENGRWREYVYGCPECVEGDSEVLEYCPDGYTVKRERICEDGSWVYYNYDCPLPYETFIKKIRDFILNMFNME